MLYVLGKLMLSHLARIENKRANHFSTANAALATVSYELTRRQKTKIREKNKQSL